MSSGSSGGGSSNGGMNKVAAVLAGALGIVGLIIVLGGGGGGSSDVTAKETVVPTTPPVAAATIAQPTRAPSATNAPPAGFDKEQLRNRDPNAVIVTVTAFGMPARVGIEAQNAGEVRSRGMFVAGNLNLACLPDAQYPNACVSYIVVQRGATVTVTAGNSRAGYWPILEKLSGGGCDRTAPNSDKDVTCTITVFQDADIVATYYGDTTPDGKYFFPKCPANRGAAAATSPWIARCQ